MPAIFALLLLLLLRVYCGVVDQKLSTSLAVGVPAFPVPAVCHVPLQAH